MTSLTQIEAGRAIPGHSKLQVHLWPERERGETRLLLPTRTQGEAQACRYCYVPLACKMDRQVFQFGRVHLARTIRLWPRKTLASITQPTPASKVKLSFTSDPYHPGDTS